MAARMPRGAADGPFREELTMKTMVIAASLPQLPSWLRLTTRLPDFVTLMKPRMMSLAVLTALVGLLITPGHLDPLGSVAILAIAASAGAAGVLNMWYDADIDAIMARTARRPFPRGRVSRSEALVFGLTLAVNAVVFLALATNIKAAAPVAFTIFFYVVVYTMWLKRSTPQNIVIGGATGAVPPVVGWPAAAGEIGAEPLVLLLVVFLWTPPHFWAHSLNRADEYARAGVPMLPVVAGRAATTRHILVYSLLLLPVSMFVVFAALLTSSNRSSTILFARTPAAVAFSQAASLSGNVEAVRSSVGGKADEA